MARDNLRIIESTEMLQPFRFCVKSSAFAILLEAGTLNSEALRHPVLPR